MIKVSVIVPVYKVEKYIDKCLDSLVKQTLKEIEIIVVNDGSPDNSQEIIDKYVEKYPKLVKSFITENGGQGAARNFGLTKAKGEYIGFVDSDDYIEKDMFEKLYNEAIKDSYDIVSCNSSIVDCDGKEIGKSNQGKGNSHFNMFFGLLEVWNKIYKKELLINNKITFRTNVRYEDVDFTVKCIINSNKFSLVDEKLHNYLFRQGSAMNNNDLKRNIEITYAFDEIFKIENYEKYKDEIEYLAIYNIYIAAVVRAIRSVANKKEKKKIINELIKYVEKNFPNFKKNKLMYKLNLNKKIIYNLVKTKQFWLIKLIFIVKKNNK